MVAVLEEKPLLKLNLGCGKSKMDGYLGVDSIRFGDNVDVVADLKKKWPWPDNSVDQIHMSHVLEHFDGQERVHIFNEMHRVMVNGGKAILLRRTGLVSEHMVISPTNGPQCANFCITTSIKIGGRAMHRIMISNSTLKDTSVIST